jgi:hypothetical protein
MATHRSAHRILVPVVATATLLSLGAHLPAAARPDNLDPASLDRGADPSIAYLVGDTIRDGHRTVPATTLGRHERLWTLRTGYLLEDWVQRRTRFRLVHVSPSGQKQVVGSSPWQISTAVSPSTRRVAWAQGANELVRPTHVRVADPRSGRVLASRAFPWARVVAVSKHRVLLVRRAIRQPVATLWWNYRRDTLRTISGRPALRADLRHNRVVFAAGHPDSFCIRVAPLSHPRSTLWRSCRIAPHAWSPDGRHALGTNTYFDAPGSDRWLTLADPTGRRTGRIVGRLDWQASWEDDHHFLTLAQSDRGKAAIVRCTLRGQCERASRLWRRPVDLDQFYVAPPVVLSSN